MFFERASRGERRVARRWYGPLPWSPGQRTGRGEPTLPRGPAPVPALEAVVAGAATGTGERPVTGVDLRARIGTASFAFRGYDLTNLGRSPELLAHPAYGPVVERQLAEASAIASEALGRHVDLARRVREQTPSSLAAFGEDAALIVAMELAQLALLEQFFGVAVASARQSLGYSLGEMTALVAGRMFRLEHLLPVPLACADDCAELTAGTTLGVLFSRGPALPLERVQALCKEVSAEGRGLIGPSAYLSPNTVLVMGQGDTLARLEAAMPGFLPATAALRRKPHALPPLHTPLVWQRNIPNRAATALYRIAARPEPPVPPVVSCVTGRASYDPRTARDILVRWVDHPQLLWDAIDETLRAGVETLIHTGPAPNLIPATFQRLGNNVARQLGHSYWSLIGRGVGSGINRYAWLSRLLPSRAALLRAPFLTHVVLEDWLLEQDVSGA
jgi:[acyl-carrier-protein] S-malonyltransferase